MPVLRSLRGAGNEAARLTPEAKSPSASAAAAALALVRIGCAGWSIPRTAARRFAGAGTHLQRYASRFNAVEINSSFYRPHRRATYERWASSVPKGFSFSVKMPREITHDARLTREAGLDEFFRQVSGLGTKLAVVLVQLPPSLALDVRTVRRFFTAMRARYAGAVVCEPRHASWFTPRADALLRDACIGRVAADPACVPAASEPGGWPDFAYFRLHGSPRMYWSAYETGYLDALGARLRTSTASTRWCVFDNTAGGAAAENALYVVRRVRLANKHR